MESVASGIAEPIMAMGSGMFAKPVSDVAGLTQLLMQGARRAGVPGIEERDPLTVKQDVQRAFTYEPRTAAGKATTEYNPLALISKGVGAVGSGARELIAPPKTAGPVRSAVGAGVEEAISQIPGLLGAKAGKSVAEGLPAKQAALDVEKSLAAPKDAIRNAAQQAGYITPPETGVKAALSGLAGKARAEKDLSAINAPVASRRFAQEVGIGEDVPLTHENVQNRIREAYAGWDNMVQAVGPRLELTKDYQQALSGTLAKINEKLGENRELNADLIPAQRLLMSYLKKFEAPKAPPPGTGAPPIFGTLEKTAGEQPGPAIARTLEQAAAGTPGEHGFGTVLPARATPVPTPPNLTMPTKQAVADISKLREQASQHFRAGDNGIAFAKQGIADQLEGLFEQNLAKTGQQALVDKFRADRVLQAKLHFIDRVVDDAGQVNLAKVASLADTKAYSKALTGELKLAADFARTWRKAAQRPTGEAAPRFSVFDGMFAVGALTAGHPWAAAVELGGRYGIPIAAERGLMQNRTPSYRAGGQALVPGLPLAGFASDPRQLQNAPQ